MKFKIHQTVWFFDRNLWKPIKDVVYDYSEKDKLYSLENERIPFDESELFSTSAKCKAAYN